MGKKMEIHINIACIFSGVDKVDLWLSLCKADAVSLKLIIFFFIKIALISKLYCEILIDIACIFLVVVLVDCGFHYVRQMLLLENLSFIIKSAMIPWSYHGIIIIVLLPQIGIFSINFLISLKCHLFHKIFFRLCTRPLQFIYLSYVLRR